jgi:hypothetical protein
MSVCVPCVCATRAPHRLCHGSLMTVAIGMAYRRGSADNSDGSGSRLGKRRHNTYPGSGPSSPEVKPLHPALDFIISTRWLIVLLELCCLEEEEEVFDLPILRVQTPLYRQGPGYRVSSGCPAASFSVAATLAWVPLPFAPLPRRRILYKVPLSPGSAYPGYMPPASLESLRGEGFCLVWLTEAVRG